MGFKLYEGEVMAYDITTNLYHIKYREGNTDDYNYDELKKYKKIQQKYRKVLKLLKIETQTTKSSQDHAIFFIVTKGQPKSITT